MSPRTLRKTVCDTKLSLILAWRVTVRLVEAYYRVIIRVHILVLHVDISEGTLKATLEGTLEVLNRPNPESPPVVAGHNPTGSIMWSIPQCPNSGSEGILLV